MKISYYILIIFNSLALCDSNVMLFNEANEFFLKKNYEKSVELYETLIEDGYINSSTLYNLGNAYYRLNRMGQSIWAYKNAKKIRPRDQDIDHNLQFAEAQMTDRIISPSLFIVHEFYRKVKLFFTIFELSTLGGAFFFILSFIWTTRKLVDLKTQALRKAFQFFLTITIFIHVLIIDTIIDRKRNKNEAVIIDRVDAMSGPLLGDNKILFKINEGTVVEVMDKKNEWCEIILIDGKKGWVVSTALRKML